MSDGAANGTTEFAAESHAELTGRSGFRRLLAPLLLGLYGLCALFLWVEETWRPEWDGGIYLLAARSLAEGEGYSYLGQPFFLRPPGLSWLLSFYAPGPTYDWTAVNRFFAAWAVAAVAAVYVYLRAEEKTRRWALPCALLVGTTPLFVRNLNWVFSEFPFLALFLLGLAALERGGRRGPRWWAWSVLGAVLLAGAFHMRSVVLLGLPAIALCGWRSDRRWQRLRALLPVAVFGTLVAPWTLHARAVAENAPVPSEQLRLFDYGTALFHVDPGDPSSDRLGTEQWMARLERNAAEFSSDLANSLFGSRAVIWQWVVWGVLAAGFVVSLWRGPDLLDGFFPFYVALLLFYFAYDDRLALPLAPYLYLYTAQLASALGGLLRPRIAPALLPAAALGGLFLVNVASFERVLDARSWPLGERWALGALWETRERAASWIAQNTPEDANILCAGAPILSVLSSRRCYTYHFLRSDGFLERYDIDYAVLDGPARPALVGYLRARAVASEVIEAPLRDIEVLIMRKAPR